MRSIDLGDGFPVGSAIRIQASLIEAMGKSTVYSVIFIPACEDDSGNETACDLDDDATWTFESGAKIPDLDDDYATYPLGLLEVLQARSK
jgi:hypothetical protein